MLDLGLGRDLAERLGSEPGLRLRTGVVTAVPGSGATVTITLAGNATAIAGVRTLQGVGVGDVVVVLQDGPTLLVLGTIGPSVNVSGVFEATEATVPADYPLGVSASYFDAITGFTGSWSVLTAKRSGTVMFQIASQRDATPEGDEYLICRLGHSAGTPEWGAWSLLGGGDTGWIVPTLGNSWVALNASSYPVGYRKTGEVVRLRGLIRAGTNNAAVFTLPAAFRPATSRFFPATTYVGSLTAPSLSAVIVGVTGIVEINGPPTTTAGYYVSLDGVEFVAGH